VTPFLKLWRDSVRLPSDSAPEILHVVFFQNIDLTLSTIVAFSLRVARDLRLVHQTIPPPPRPVLQGDNTPLRKRIFEETGFESDPKLGESL